MKWNKELLEKINRADLVDFFKMEVKRTDKKPLIIDKAYELIKDDEILSKKLYDKYKDLLAIHPIQVEEMLGITKAERKRWNNSKLKISYYDSFHKYGRYIEYPMYDYECITNISSSDIEKWREEHTKQTSKNRKDGAKKAVETRKKNKQVVKEFYDNEWISMLSQWKDVDIELYNTYQLAFWTMWLSRLAKSFQLKSYRSTKYKDLYNNKKEDYYKMKNEAIELLSKSKYCDISFYRPENPDKLWVDFCDFHYNMWCDERHYIYMDKWDFYYTHTDMLNKCSECNIERNEDYYSLYYIELFTYKAPDFKFSFHTPYPIGKSIFGNPEILKQVEHKENEEGLFRFGRAIDESEEVIFTEKRILKYFEKAKTSYKEYLDGKECLESELNISLIK